MLGVRNRGPRWLKLELHDGLGERSNLQHRHSTSSRACYSTFHLRPIEVDHGVLQRDLHRTAMTVSRGVIVHAYRHLYRHLLRAVQYSIPARFTARDRLRNAFRKSPVEEYNQARIDRTLEFLDGAARVRGLEHRIVKNAMHVWWEQKKLATMYM